VWREQLDKVTQEVQAYNLVAAVVAVQEAQV
jgi:hypothetical protein